MKQEFCMTQEEMDTIIAINKDHTSMPVMKIFEGATSKKYETIRVECPTCKGSGDVPKKVEINYTVLPSWNYSGHV